MRGKRPDIIVVGASAGGIEVLLRLMRELPRDLAASVFVVVHRGAAPGHLAEVLGRRGQLTTVAAKDATTIVPRRVYIAPPGFHLTLKNYHTQLSVGPKINRHRPAVDPLFLSAAHEYGSRVIGVVLSGYLDDGSAGLAAIKEQGGIAIVQDPDDAVAPDMPRNALRAVDVDYCLPAAEIAPLLVKLVNGRPKKFEEVDRHGS